MLGDDPPSLSVGTEVSAKYKGAFCEAKIKKVVRSVKCRVTYKQGLGTATITDDQIKGTLRVGASVEARFGPSDKKEFVEATITKIQDCSQYTVVFDDGDITTLRRTALCLKSGRHFAESETLDQLPLTHPEHFGNPVIGGRRGRRSRQTQDESSEDEDSPPRGESMGSGFGGKTGAETEPEIGRVVCVELGDKKKKDNWFPGLVVAPTAQDTVRIRVRDDYLVRSFKDARYYTVPKKEATEFTKELGNKVENSALKVAVEKALLFLEKNELPPHWDRDSLFGNTVSSGNSDSDGELYSDSSDDEPREEKDHFVAQLYKFMDDRGTPINTCPMIGNQDIDLYRLFRAVYKLGGYNRVTNHNQWKIIARRLNFTMQNSTTTHNLVKQSYKKYLHSFEDFYRKLGCTMVNHPRGGIRKQRPGRSLIRDKDRNTPVPIPVIKTEKEDEEEKKEKEKKPVEEEKKEPIKREIKKEPIIKEEEPPKLVKKKEDPESSGHDSDINVEGDESSSSEKSQKSLARLTPSGTGKGKAKIKEKEEVPKKKPIEKKKVEPKKPEKKEEVKVKEEDAAKTRSKATKEEVVTKTKPSSEVRETRTPSRETEAKKAFPKQRRLTEDELKKRGRKRKDTDGEKSRSDEKNVEYSPSYKGPVDLGDRLKVYYGPTHESKVTYEAKVIDMEKDGSEPVYLVHYTGWNTRYDEWIKAPRIAQNFTQAQGRVKRSKITPRPQTPSSGPSGNVPKLVKTPLGAQSRRRAQSVAPSGSSMTSLPAKETKKEEKESGRDTSMSARSSTPSPLTGYVTRTKSPATPASYRSTRTTRNLDPVGVEIGRRTRRTSGHADALVASESDETESCESDQSEPETPSRSKVKGVQERSRREARRRAESRMKIEDMSDGETEKETIDEPRRGRRSRKTLTKIQDIKSEPESDEEQPKGRDFDLNQIRSELKGFDKAVKMEIATIEPEPIEKPESPVEPIVLPEPKIEIPLSPKPEKKKEPPKVEAPTLTPVKRDVPKVEPPPVLTPVKREPVKVEPVPVENTEDIYEFKEPEPFEFEVRNKRDSGGADKDKVKKRVFDEEIVGPSKRDSPKKRQKTFASLAPKPEVKAETPPENVEQKKKVRKIFGKRNDTPEETPRVLPHTPSREEIYEKIAGETTSTTVTKPSNPVEEPKRAATSLDLLFAIDLPGDDDCVPDDAEDRLIISETEVSEAEQENLFTYQQEIFPNSDTVTDSMEFNGKEEEKVKIQPEVTQPENKPSPLFNIDRRRVVVSPLAGKSTEMKLPEPKPLDFTALVPPTLPVPAPISTRLPATSSIEEKLSAAAVYRSKAKEKKEDEYEIISRKFPKEINKRSFETPAKKNKEEQARLKQEAEKKKQLALEQESAAKKQIEEIEQHKDPLLAVMKDKEEQIEQLKAKRESKLKNVSKPTIESKKEPEMKIEKDWRKEEKESIDDDLLSKAIESEKVKNDFDDSSDSSDSEQRLTIIDHDEFPEDKPIGNMDTKLKPEIDKFQGIQDLADTASLQTPHFSSVHPIKVTKPGEEDGETMSSLLCEEEIPGSPTPGLEVAEPEQQIGVPQPISKKEVQESTTTVAYVEMPFSNALSTASPNTAMIAAISTTQVQNVSIPVPVPHVAVPTTRQLPVQQIEVPPPVQIQVQRRESNEAAPVMDNTPPTTPDSSISNISESSREERTGGSTPTSEDNSKLNRDSSEAENEGGSKGPGLSEDDASSMNTEGNTTERLPKPLTKRTTDDALLPKKRKKRKEHSETSSTNSGKKSPRQGGGNRSTRHGTGSDSDDTSQGSNLFGTSTATTTTTTTTTVNSTTELVSYSSRSPSRQTKYNFFVELDPDLDSNQRISILQQKLTELRKTYNSVKLELAGIERRRKKLKRREREAIKAAKAEMQQACS